MDSSLNIPEIKIVPVGIVDPELLEYLALTISGNLGTRCANSPISIEPRDAYNARRQQYSSTKILAALLELNSGDGAKTLGVAQVDLFIPILTFVFGEAQLGGEVALMSSHRLQQQFYGLPENKQLFYERAEKEAIHELGHTYGLIHCHSYDCVMHFSNSVEQVDLKSAVFCQVCSRLFRALVNGPLAVVS